MSRTCIVYRLDDFRRSPHRQTPEELLMQAWVDLWVRWMEAGVGATAQIFKLDAPRRER